MSSFTVRDRQLNAISAMLNLNRARAERAADVWKVLIYDDTGRDILAPLMKVGQLRQNGVTLHLPLHSNRLPVPDVPAVYFVQPTTENIDRIVQDVKDRLYDAVYLNFAGSTPRVLLERLAKGALAADSAGLIAKVHDQHVNFLSLEPDLFSLQMRQSYISFNDTKVSDSLAEANIARVADGLLAVCCSLGVQPIIRCARNGAAEMIARALAKRLHEASPSTAAADVAATGIGAGAAFRRPILVLLERNADKATPLHHPWTYQALVHDVLKLDLNRVQVTEESESCSSGEASSTTSYDLGVEDKFWVKHRGALFQQVAIEVKAELNSYTEQVAEIERLKGSAATNELNAVVSSLPELREKKTLIDAHASIATAVLKDIKARELDAYYAAEEAMLARTTVDKVALRRLLSDEGPGTKADKLRLAAIHTLAGSSAVPSDELSSMIASEAGKKLLQQLAGSHSNATASSSNAAAVGGVLPRMAYDSLASFTSIAVDRLKSLLPQQKQCHATKIVRALMDNSFKAAREAESYLYFDPKLSATPLSTSAAKATFKEAIAFVIGGGCYMEYQDLQNFASGKSTKQEDATGATDEMDSEAAMRSVLYGSTEIVTGEEFLEQMLTLLK